MFDDHPLNHSIGTDEEIAAAILFAASDEAAFMNGATITIDGGMAI